MRLDLDCIRDIMLWAETLTTPTQIAIYIDVDMLEKNSFLYVSESDKPVPNKEQLKLLDKYDNEKLVYHINYCLEAELLKSINTGSMITTAIKDLTPLGHDFMANIRKEENYNSIKSKAISAGIESVKAVIRIGEEVAASAIAKTLTT